MKAIHKTTETMVNTVLSDKQLAYIVGGAHKVSTSQQSYLSISFEQIKTPSKTKTIVDVVYAGSTAGLLGLAVILRSAIQGGSPGTIIIG